jgi:hypothetical protein
MATYDDSGGVWFTIQAIRMFHPEVADKLAFLVVDNHPEGAGATDLKNLERSVPFFRYVPFRGYRGRGPVISSFARRTRTSCAALTVTCSCTPALWPPLIAGLRITPTAGI